MSKIASDVCLAVFCAGLTALTFQVPIWTGVKSSFEWPTGAAILLTIVWAVIRRRDGFRTCMLDASVIGVGVGFWVAFAVRMAQTGKAQMPGLVVISLPIVSTVFYVLSLRTERKADQYQETLEQEFEAIKAMPPNEARKALEARFDEYQTLLEDFEKREPGLRRKRTLVLWAVLALTPVLLATSIWPEPRPVGIILGVAILILCVTCLKLFSTLPPT
ncbi:MAG TPA: hypothetical protein PLH94_10440 [Fimbriimonadaceae bacterium]|nr:hypothetical protein [Fimbriimonadaceae bacterium]